MTPEQIAYYQKLQDELRAMMRELNNWRFPKWVS